MRLKLFVLPIGASLLALPALATPPEAQQSSGSASATASSDAPDPNERICRRVAPATGSRLAAKRQCATRAQWEDLENNAGFARRGIEAMQTQRTCTDSGC